MPRRREHGITAPGEPVRMPAQGRLCGQMAGPDWCQEPVFARGLCRRHYRRAAKDLPIEFEPDKQVGVTRSGFGLWGVVAEQDGKLECHECGKWCRSLAVHIGSVHGSVREYRLEHGLPMSASLVADDITAANRARAIESHAIARLEGLRTPESLKLADPERIIRGMRLRRTGR